MKVVLISGHSADSDRKTGFHFWAEILANRKIDVDFITVGVSPISLLKKNGKQLKKPYNEWVQLTDHIRKYIWMPPFHPVNFGAEWMNKFTYPFFKLYPLMLPKAIKDAVRQADLFVVENGAGLMIVPKLSALNPRAKFIYNFSDRFDVVKFHPVIPDSQKKALPKFSMIRLNASKFRQVFPANAPTKYIPQAIDKTVFDQAVPNPYKTPRNAISVGDMLFDAATIEKLAVSFPDWTFHIFGREARLPTAVANVIEYGEKPFYELIPYMKHADIGIAPYAPAPDADYLSESSLKLVQYTYCKLPIVAPDFAAQGRDHAIAYNSKDPNDCVRAFAKAMKLERRNISTSEVMGWDDVIDRMMDTAMKRSA